MLNSKSRRTPPAQSVATIARHQFPERKELIEREELIAGLRQSPPRLPSKYLYDRRGSELFDQICELPEYYLTRTELAIMTSQLGEIASMVGPHAAILELGSGSGLKTQLLLQALTEPKVYVPVDISAKHLSMSAANLAQQFPQTVVQPLCTDFMRQIILPTAMLQCKRRVIYFPGSTLGNLNTKEADGLLRRLAKVIRGGEASERIAPSDCGLLLGVDLQKSLDVLLPAYNDAAGMTAEFNCNLLRHINRKFGCQIPLDAFHHRAPYNVQRHRVEMHLVAERQVSFAIDAEQFQLERGEYLLTEYSHKYALPQLAGRLATSGWTVEQTWTDERQYFAVIYCSLSSPS